MIQISQTKVLTEDLYTAIMDLWLETGITNPARADSFEAIHHNLQNTGTLILAYQDSYLAGAVWVNHDFRRLYIHHMAVRQNLQNQGIGRKLLAEALKIAKETGYQAKLEVNSKNDSARHLYKSLGFTDLDGYITMIKREI